MFKWAHNSQKKYHCNYEEFCQMAEKQKNTGTCLEGNQMQSYFTLVAVACWKMVKSHTKWWTVIDDTYKLLMHGNTLFSCFQLHACSGNKTADYLPSTCATVSNRSNRSNTFAEVKPRPSPRCVKIWSSKPSFLIIF